MLAVRKALGVLVSLIALAGVVVTVVLATRRIDERPRTDDAYLQADLVHLAPDVSGRIIELDVRDNQKVRKGEVLFRIDPEPYQMRVDQARAAVQGLEAKLALTADQVAAQTSKADAAASGISTADAQRALASSTLARMEPLLGHGFVTAQQVDQARHSAAHRPAQPTASTATGGGGPPRHHQHQAHRGGAGGRARDARTGRARSEQNRRAGALRWPNHRA